MSSAFWLTVGRDALASAVSLTIARLVVWRPLHNHRVTQQKIVDLLDTHTPGGLKDVVDALIRHERRRRGGGDDDDDGDGSDGRRDPRARPDARRADAGRPAGGGDVARPGRG